MRVVVQGVQQAADGGYPDDLVFARGGHDTSVVAEYQRGGVGGAVRTLGAARSGSGGSHDGRLRCLLASQRLLQ